MLEQTREIWRFRELLVVLARTQFKLRHAGSLLGILWTLVGPAVFIALYWFIFTRVVDAGIDRYLLYLIPGYLAWNFTIGALQNSASLMEESKQLFPKIAFPQEIVVLAGVAVVLADFLIALAMFLAAALMMGPAIPVAAALFPLVLVLHTAFVLGVCFIVAGAAVYYRDVGRLLPILAMLLFFLTPVFYSLESIPPETRAWAWLNPLTVFVELYHSLFHAGTLQPQLLAAGLVVAAVSLAGGLLVFRRIKPAFAELS
jgi:ABC-type polysaccharide/polyol phosphate export permease